MVHDLVELLGDLAVDFSDGAVEGADDQVLVEGHSALERLFCQRVLIRSWARSRSVCLVAPIDLVEQAEAASSSVVVVAPAASEVDGMRSWISPPSCRGRAWLDSFVELRPCPAAPAPADLPARPSDRPCSSGRAAWPRVSSSAFSAGTCSATLAGSKSSMLLNFRSTAIWLPSPASVLSTLIFRPGWMRAITSLKLSRSIWTNLRSSSGLQRLGRVAGEIAHDATTKGSSRMICAPSVSTS
jgi:hypothetical protein